MTSTKTRGRTVVAGTAVLAAVITVGALSLKQSGSGDPVRCGGSQGVTSEIDLEVTSLEERTLDIEWFVTGNDPGEERNLVTRHWVAVETANCPGSAQLSVRSVERRGSFVCRLRADGTIVAQRRAQGSEECFVQVTLVRP